jgi:hypothetical protein
MREQITIIIPIRAGSPACDTDPDRDDHSLLWAHVRLLCAARLGDVIECNDIVHDQIVESVSAKHYMFGYEINN